MAHYVTVYRAARLLGMSRTEVQQHIRDGHLDTFEGMVDVDELQRAYPQTQLHDDSMLEQVERYKDDAVGKYVHQMLHPSSEELLRQVAGLHNELQHASHLNAEYTQELECARASLQQSEQRAASYLGLVVELKDRLLEMQEKCDQRQKLMLGTLLAWLAQRVEEKQHGG